MRPSVDDIITEIFRREGGYVDRVSDRGGPTNMGITAATLGEWRKLGRHATRAEIRTLGEEEARAIYQHRYVRPWKDVYEPLRSLLADWTVTSGLDDPTKALQVALQRRGVYAGKVDGIFGAKTQAALVRDPQPRETYRDVFRARVEFYLDVALHDPLVRQFRKEHPTSQIENVRGWSRRALEFCP